MIKLQNYFTDYSNTITLFVLKCFNLFIILRHIDQPVVECILPTKIISFVSGMNAPSITLFDMTQNQLHVLDVQRVIIYSLYHMV